MKNYGLKTKFYVFGKPYKYSKKERAEIIARKMPEEYKKRTNLNFEEYIASEEEIVKELLETSKKFGRKSDLNRLWKNLYKGNYEYADYIANLQRTKEGTKESFYTKYKNEKYKGKKLKDYLEEFRLGLLTKNELNNILMEFKKQNEKYISSGSS